MKKPLLSLTLIILTLKISVAQTGIRGCYPLDNNAMDNSGNNFHGTAFNVSPANDHLNNANGAYHFSGSGSYITLPSSCFLLNEFTYSVWCNPSSLPNSGGYYSILSIGGSSADQHILLGNNSSLGQVGFGAGTWSSTVQAHACYNGTLPTINQWYHLVMTRDNSTMNFYINNTLICSVSSGGTAGYLNSPVAATIGSRLTSSSQNFRGDIDDVRIFNRVLTLSEIQNMPAPCPMINTNCPVGNYPLDNNALDVSGNSYDGTAFNVTPTADHLSIPNGAYHFSGPGSYISLPSACYLMNEFTYSVWCNPSNIPTSGNYYSIISIGGSAADQHVLLGNNSSLGQVGFGAGTWSSSIQAHACYSGTLPATNQWYHLVMTRDNSNMNFYINNTLICTVSSGGNAGYLNNPVSATIGSRLTSSSQNFRGDIDDVRIYNRVLTLSEIQNITTLCIPTSVSEISNDILTTVYPNPSNNYFIIDVNSSDQNNYQLILKDLLGRKLQHWNSLDMQKPFNFGINLSNGVYFAEIIIGNNKKVVKLIKSN